MLYNMFAKIALYTIHLIVEVFIVVFHYLNLRKPLDFLLDKIFHISTVSVKVTSTEANQVPEHLGFLIAEDRLSIKDLANLIAWSATLGITCISLYDHDGVLKKHKTEFIKMLSLSKDINPSSDSNYNLVFVKGEKKQTIVKLLCHLDGKCKIAKVASSICKKVHQGVLKSEDVNIDLVTENLQLQPSCADPEAIVVFGPVHSTFGYLPWHIRLTEIFVLPSHHSISQKSFHDVLNAYASCQKRFGT